MPVTAAVSPISLNHQDILGRCLTLVSKSRRPVRARTGLEPPSPSPSGLEPYHAVSVSPPAAPVPTGNRPLRREATALSSTIMVRASPTSPTTALFTTTVMKRASIVIVEPPPPSPTFAMGKASATVSSSSSSTHTSRSSRSSRSLPLPPTAVQVTRTNTRTGLVASGSASSLTMSCSLPPRGGGREVAPETALKRKKRPQRLPLDPAATTSSTLLSAYRLQQSSETCGGTTPSSPTSPLSGGNTTSFVLAQWSSEQLSPAEPPQTSSSGHFADLDRTLRRSNSAGTFGRSRQTLSAPLSASSDRPLFSASTSTTIPSSADSSRQQQPGAHLVRRRASFSSVSTRLSMTMDDRPLSPAHLRGEDDQTIEAHLRRIREKKANAIVPPAPLLPQSTPFSAPPTLGEFPELTGFTQLRSLWLDDSGTVHQEKGRSTAVAVGAGEHASEKTNPLLPAVTGLQRRTSAATTKPLPSNHPVGLPLDRHAHSLDLTNVASRDTLGSLGSLNPSFSESVTTLSGLLPASQMRKRKLMAQSVSLAPENRVPPTLASKSELGAEQKAVLIRRTRKLEQLLGETLGERQVERYVIDPSTAPTMVQTHIDEKSWPRPSSKPEWEREDCVPRIATNPLPAIDQPTRPGHQRTKSRLERAREMFLGPSTPPIPPQIQVFVARETHVAETGPRKVQPLNLGTASRARLPVVPVSPTSPNSPGFRDEDAEDVTFRERRTRLSKLQRLLGAPVPPELLTSPYSTCNSPNSPNPPHADDPTVSTHSLPALDSQFHNRYGGAKIRHSSSVSERRRSGNAPPGLTALVNSSPMPDDERKVALRRANKLDQMFGDTPPANLFLPAFQPDRETHSEGGHPSASAPELSPRPEREVYESYRYSIQGLIHLIEHDQTRLATIVDELTMATLVDEFGTSTPAPPPPNRRPTSPVSPRLVRSLSKAKRWSVDMVRSMSPTASPTSPSRASGWPQHRFSHNSMPVSPTSPSSRSSESTNTSAGTRSSMGTRESHSRLPPIPHSPTTPAAPDTARRTAKLGRFFGEEGLDFSTPPPPVELRSPTPDEPESSRGRAQTLDSVLGELWRSVQADMKRGGLGQADAARLNDLMRTLGRKRAAAGEWAEL